MGDLGGGVLGEGAGERVGEEGVGERVDKGVRRIVGEGKRRREKRGNEEEGAGRRGSG